jgi:hypothetical protein
MVDDLPAHRRGRPASRPGVLLVSLTGHMARLKSAIVVLLVWWLLELVAILPIMWATGSSGPAMLGTFVFAGIVAGTVVGASIALGASQRRRDRREMTRGRDDD